MRTPDFILEKRRGATIWISPSYADPLFVELLADPDRMLSDANCRIIKDERKITIGCLTVHVGAGARSLYVKKYHAFSLRYRLFSPFTRSGALRSLQGATVLREAGIPTATPVAAVESRRWGMMRKSFYLSEEITGGKTADAHWEELKNRKGREGFKCRVAFLRQLARLFHSLHAQHIYHNDLKDANILVATQGGDFSVELFLLDLEGVRSYARLSDRRRVKNLTQLYRTLGKYVSPSRRLFFLKCYLGPLFADRRRRRELIHSVLRSAEQVERSKARTTAVENLN